MYNHYLERSLKETCAPTCKRATHRLPRDPICWSCVPFVTHQMPGTVDLSAVFCMAACARYSADCRASGSRT